MTPGVKEKILSLRWGVLAATVITLLSLMPQFHLWLVRGFEWHGTYATFQGDEFLYASYINALIDGRPLRNDPPAGLDHTPQAPIPESLFSIQFVPPLILSFFGRLFGVSASTLFVILPGVTGLAASLSLYWLLTSVTGDKKFSAVGVLFVLCLGTLTSGQGLIGMFLEPVETSFLGLPFLRRYVPSAAFPGFFVFCTLVWKALVKPGKNLGKALLAGAVLGLLVFSYFFLWTAAVAWCLCLGILWFTLRPPERIKATRVVVIIGSMLLIALGYYAWLLAARSPNVNSAYLLTLTRQPELFRIPEVFGFLVLGMLAVAKRQGKLTLNHPTSIFAASFALLPFILLNQQVITGRSLQPYHYEVFVANYVVLIGLFLAAKAVWPLMSNQLLVIASFCILWGALEISLSAQARVHSDVTDDEIVPVLLRLKELANQDGSWHGLRQNGKTPARAFSPEMSVMRLLPTWAPQATLPEVGSGAFRSPSRPERKQVLFSYLYYSAHDKESLRQLLGGGTGMLEYYTQVSLFGPERLLPFLTHEFRPISNDEIERELNEYQAFLGAISKDEVLERPLTYLITHTNIRRDLTNVDRWYERDNGEVLGVYTLYKLNLRK